MGGTSPVLRKDREGADRECIYIELLPNSSTSASTFVEGKVVGFDRLFNNQPFEYGCFQETCFVGSGVWTLAYKNKLIESITYRNNNLDTNECFDGCFEDFNQVCRMPLPLDYEGPLAYSKDESGKFIFVDVTEEYCSQDLTQEETEPYPSLEGFITDIHIEGYKSLYTYKVDGLTYAIEEGSEDAYYKLYLLAEEDHCLDECSFSRLRLLGFYNSNKETIHEIFIPTDTQYNNSTIINDDFLNNTSDGSIFSSSGLINDDSLYYVLDSELYGYTTRYLEAHPDIDMLRLEYWTRKVLDKHKEISIYRREYSTSHKCIRYCNSRKIDINGIEVIYNSDYEVWVEGLSDGEYIYVADIGYVHPLNHEMVVWDRNVPLTSGGIFRSRKPIPEGRKIVKIKRINKAKEEVVLHHINQDVNTFRTSTGHLLNYSYNDQLIDIEELSLTLINILLSSFTYNENCSIYTEKKELDRDLLEFISNRKRTKL
jgi:hypothetical protein